MKHPDLVATIKDGQLVFGIPRLLQAVLSGIGEGVQVRVDIKKWYKKRSTSQNSLIWGPDYAVILAHIQQTTGQIFTPEELHDWQKRNFLGFEESAYFKGLYKIKSTKDLDVAEFSTFREKYCKFWAENGLYIPDPQ